jgi:hypothetical protein
MRNTINIKDDVFYTIVNENGADGITVKYLNPSTTPAYLELYLGMQFYDVIALRNVNGVLSATLPTEILTGNVIHFRLPDDQFYHIIYTPEESLIIKMYDYVVCGNKTIAGTSNMISGEYNSYNDIAEFLQSELYGNTHTVLRGGNIEANG